MKREAIVRDARKMRRLRWLVENQEIWQGFPFNDHRDFEIRNNMVAGLRKAGLISKKTHGTDINWERMISDARKLRSGRLFTL